MKNILLLMVIVMVEVALLSWIFFRVYQRNLAPPVQSMACERFVFSDQFSSDMASVKCVLRQMADLTIQPGTFRARSGMSKGMYVYSPTAPDDSMYTPVLVVNGSDVNNLKWTLKEITKQTKWSSVQKGVLILTHTSQEFARTIGGKVLMYKNESESQSGVLGNTLKMIEQSFPALESFSMFFMGDPCVQDRSVWVPELRLFFDSLCD